MCIKFLLAQNAHFDMPFNYELLKRKLRGEKKKVLFTYKYILHKFIRKKKKKLI